MNSKIVIIGCGNVGMSYIYALINQNTYVNEIVLIDKNIDKVEAEVMDLNDSLAYIDSKINIRKGNYSDCMDAQIIIITAGFNQKNNQSRLDLLNKNSKILKNIVSRVIKNDFNGIFLVATNPVDVMSYLVYKCSKFDSNRVIGTGTSIDTSRLKKMLGDNLCINPQNIDCYVLGEHGDSSFISWSNINIGLNNISSLINEKVKKEYEINVKEQAYKIINKKGATYYAIGVLLVKITKAILENENIIMPLSIYDKDNDVFISRPCIINNKGIRNLDLLLNQYELKKYNTSVNILKNEIKKMQL